MGILQFVWQGNCYRVLQFVKGAQSGMQGSKVLIIDDSRLHQVLLSGYIEGMGFDVSVANDGESGIDAFSQYWPDLILLDVHMKGISGFETAVKIREMQEKWANWVPIIFLSENMTDEDVVAAINASGDDCLSKPVSEMVLKAKVKAMMRMAKDRREAIKVAESLVKANEELEKMLKISNMDALTNISNRRHFDTCLEREWGRNQRNQSEIGMLLLDIDYFKLYNDNYGHIQGDACLKQVAWVIQKTIQRAGDVAFRYGGEEFAVLLAETDMQGLQKVAENIIEAFQTECIAHEYSLSGECITCSIGGSSVVPQQGQSSDDLLKEADKALYKAKENGRGCFCPHI